MSEAAAPGPARRRSLAAIIGCIAVYGCTIGIAGPVIGLTLESRGVDRTTIGALASTPAVAMLAFAPLIPRIVRSLGARRFLWACLASEFLMFLALPAFDWLPAWFAIRFAMGAAAVGLFVAGEAWINQIALDESRGRLIGLYNTVLAAGFACGPAIVAAVGYAGWAPYLIASGVVALAASTLLFAGEATPRLEGRPSISILAFMAIAPTLALGVAVTAFLDGAVLSLLPVYGVRSGLGEAAAAAMLTALALGNVALQVPIGWLSDLIGRRVVLVGCGFGGVVGSALLPWLIEFGWVAWAMLFLWGGVTMGIYTTALASVGDRFRGAELVTANAALGLLWGAGSVVGPSAAGAAMDWLDPNGLPLAMGVAAGAFLLVALYRYASGR
jgi:MFS family permease